MNDDTASQAESQASAEQAKQEQAGKKPKIHTDSAIIGSIVPDAVQLASADTVAQYQLVIDQTRQTCDEVSAALLADYNVAIQHCKDACNGSLTNCSACVNATIEQYKQRIDAVDAKCRQSAAQAITLAIGDAINYVQSLGVPPPTDELVQIAANKAVSSNLSTVSYNPPVTQIPQSGTVPKAGPSGMNVSCPTGYGLMVDNSGCGYCVSTDGSNRPPLYVQKNGDILDKPDPGLVCSGIFTNQQVANTSQPTPVVSPIADGSPSIIQSVPITSNPPANNTGNTPVVTPQPITNPTVPTVTNVTVTPIPGVAGDQSCEPTISYRQLNPGDVGYVTSDVAVGIEVKVTYQCQGEAPQPEDTDYNEVYPIVLDQLDHTDPVTGLHSGYFVLGHSSSNPLLVTQHVLCEPKDALSWFNTINIDKDLTTGQQIGDLFNIKGSDEPTVLQGIADTNKLTGLVYSIIGDRQGLFTDVVEAIKQAGADATKSILALSPCNQPLFYAYAVTNGLLGLVGKYLGVVPEVISSTVTYQQNMLCPYIIPTSPELNDLNRRGYITDDEWKASVSANADCVPWQKLVRDKSKLRPGIADANILYNRGFITKDDFYDYATKAGVVDGDTADLFVHINDFIPSIQDYAVWWTRGITDDTYASNAGLDNGYNDWFAANGESIANANQIDQRTSQYIYRASQRMPDIDVIMEAYRRLKGDTGTVAPGIGALEVDEDELDLLLNRSGISPVWSKRIAALTYQPISIRHLRLMYESGVYDEEELASGFAKVGYAEQDAKDLAHATALVVDKQKAQLEGMPTASDILKLFKDDGLTIDDANTLLINAGMQPESAANVLDWAIKARDASVNANNIKALKRRFLQGDYDSGQVQSKLSMYGVVNQRVSVILDQWQEELSLSHKEVAASELCKWYSRRYIDTPTYLQRMQNLGYSYSDASLFVQGCTQDAIESIAKKAAALVKQAAAAKEKQDKAAIKAAQDAWPFRKQPKPLQLPVTTRSVKETTTIKDGKAKPPVVTDTITVQMPATEEQQSAIPPDISSAIQSEEG